MNKIRTLNLTLDGKVYRNLVSTMDVCYYWLEQYKNFSAQYQRDAFNMLFGQSTDSGNRLGSPLNKWIFSKPKHCVGPKEQIKPGGLLLDLTQSQIIEVGFHVTLSANSKQYIDHLSSDNAKYVALYPKEVIETYYWDKCGNVESWVLKHPLVFAEPTELSLQDVPYKDQTLRDDWKPGVTEIIIKPRKNHTHFTIASDKAFNVKTKNMRKIGTPTKAIVYPQFNGEVLVIKNLNTFMLNYEGLVPENAIIFNVDKQSRLKRNGQKIEEYNKIWGTKLDRDFHYPVYYIETSDELQVDLTLAIPREWKKEIVTL